MAIYHFSAKVISRSKGQSSVKSAAYRSGERLHDERTGETKKYKRKVQPEAMILAPSHAPEWVHDRNRLWNEVEKIEKRKDAQLAREVEVSLPRELSNKQQKELIINYVQEQFVNKGMIADIAIHRDNQENPHAHVMLTTREISEEGFGKKNREWNDRELLNHWREEWANHANKALEREGIQDRISHLSHEARGIEALPTVHLGHVANDMEKRGVQSDRGNINRERQEYNRLVVDLQKYREEKKALEQEKARQQEQKKSAEKFTAAELVSLQEASKILNAGPSLQNIEKRLEQLNKWEKRNDSNNQFIRWKDEATQTVSNYYHEIDLANQRITNAQNEINNIGWFPTKQNREKKQNLEVNIANENKQIENYKDKINSYSEKLKFNSQQEFNLVKKQHEIERPGLLEKNRDTRKQINFYKDTLHKAENALKNSFIREIANKYPERPEAVYMSYETAKKINQVNKSNNRVVPIETIEKNVNQRKTEIQKLYGEFDRFQTIKESSLGRNELIQSQISKVEKTINAKQSSLGILESIINGLEQANRTMQQEQNRQQQTKNKTKRKNIKSNKSIER
ncbi:MobQ family relaxase [Peribacillus sp. Hz7]|uniref:MobQ family relaxase n=1 Tax=Peribacillus sp. Hz7 TaxID=3344873 RepID=UPI0035CB6E68